MIVDLEPIKIMVTWKKKKKVGDDAFSKRFDEFLVSNNIMFNEEIIGSWVDSNRE
jgi:hypothetical protein